MRTIGTLLATTALLLALAGCASSATSQDETLTDADAMSLMRDNLTFVDGYPDEDLAELAELVCTYWDDSHPGDDAALRLLKTLTDAGMTGNEAGQLPVYAAAWKCPEHSDRSNLLD